MNLPDIIAATLAGPFGNTPLARFLRDQGVSRMGAPRPAHVPRGTPGACFRNAWELCLRGGLDYHEGWAWDPATSALPFDHAWCVDPVTDTVVDPTWCDPTSCLYLGVHVPSERLCAIMAETGKYGVLDLGRGFAAGIVERYWGWTDRGCGRDDHEPCGAPVAMSERRGPSRARPAGRAASSSSSVASSRVASRG